jgi:methylenetetrahydrofolate dehydrogenase (NADP+)/methenyltetrahydrofolate cyclohydrolase
MTARIIDGKAVAAEVDARTIGIIEHLSARGVVPGLAVVLVGDDPASHTYVSMKGRACERLGIRSFDTRLPSGAAKEEVESALDRYNADPDVHGILVQLPLSDHLDTEAIINRISPEKDVDGFHPASLGALVRGTQAPRSCTPWGVMALLDAAGVEISGANAVVVGRSTIVGKPMALMLLERNATVTICHSKTRDLPAMCRAADILVAAIGRPKMIDETYVKPGAAVIDVGTSRVDGKLLGDVDFERVVPIAGAITPVPGGVGPMTIAMLMSNVAEAADRITG